jgi:hypothetical protein
LNRRVSEMRAFYMTMVGVVLAGSIGCKTISADQKAQLAKPVDCATADADIAALEAERASVGKQIASGVRMIVPAAAVVGLLSGDYRNRAQVASGKYNSALEAKIAEIKKTCAK